MAGCRARGPAYPASAVATHVLHLSPLGHSSAFSLAFTLGVLLVLPYVRERVQRLVDIIFGRQSYDAQITAFALGLATTRQFSV